jgi:hypothetical protein
VTSANEPIRLYHVRHDNFRGDTLYPLNQLANVAPDLYEAQRAKYRGREALCAQRVPVLDCLWNDVIHFSPVHPSRVREAMAAEGLGDHWRQKHWFVIDPVKLNFSAENTVIFLHRDLASETSVAGEDFEPYSIKRVRELTEVPQRTRDAYQAFRLHGTAAFLFSGVPHILHRGSIDVSHIDVIRA